MLPAETAEPSGTAAQGTGTRRMSVVSSIPSPTLQPDAEDSIHGSFSHHASEESASSEAVPRPPPMAMAAATLHALDELFASIESDEGAINADECAEWAGVCEALLSRTENMRLAVRSRCDRSALKLLQSSSTNAGLARAMSLGGAGSSLLRTTESRSNPQPQPSYVRYPVWRQPPLVKPPPQAPPAPTWTSPSALAWAEATAEAGFYAHEIEQLALSASPSYGDFLPRYSSARLTAMPASCASATRTLANRLSHDALLRSSLDPPSAIKPRVDCWRAGPRAKPTSAFRIAARERGRRGVAPAWQVGA